MANMQSVAHKVRERTEIETHAETSLGQVLQTRRMGSFGIMESRYPPGFQQPLHRHERASITLVLKGGVREQGSGLDLVCRPGDVLIKPAGVPHSDQFARTETRTLTIDFNQEPSGSANGAWGVQVGYGLQHRREVQRTLFAIWQAVHAEPDAFELEGRLLELSAALAPRTHRHEPHRSSRTPPPWLRLVRESIADRAEDRLRVRDIAAEAGVHPVYLARMFRRYFNTSVVDYILSVRLARSIDLMTAYGKPLCCVAIETGFSDQAHWCRTFKSRTGLSPSAFKRLIDLSRT